MAAEGMAEAEEPPPLLREAASGEFAQEDRQTELKQKVASAQAGPRNVVHSLWHEKRLHREDLGFRSREKDEVSEVGSDFFVEEEELTLHARPVKCVSASLSCPLRRR